MMIEDYLWLTDTHWDRLPETQLQEVMVQIVQHPAKGIIHSGDIAEPPLSLKCLQFIAQHKPIYFVLGNHDYYGHSIAELRLQLAHIESANMFYLTQLPAILWQPEVAIVGIDGFADALNAELPPDFWDREHIVDYHGLNHSLCAEKMRELALVDCQRLTQKLDALETETLKRLYLVTHIPPWLRDYPKPFMRDEPQALAIFTSKLLANTIDVFADKHPQLKIDVYSGHVHRPCSIKLKQNLTLTIGTPADNEYKADY